MKFAALLHIFIFLFLAVSSCVPGGTQNSKRIKKKTDGALSSESDTNTADAPNLSNDISWYDGQYINGLITINENYQTLLYLRGNSVHNFLDSNQNYNRKYCLVISFNESDTTAKNSFRIRAIPITINNFTTKTKERLLKLDLIDKTASSLDCNGTVNLYDNSNNPFGTSSNPAYLPSEVCPNCSGLISSLNVSLYESSAGINDLSRINNNILDLTSLGQRIDVKNNTTSGISTCSDANCSSQNFDCCIDGQCVIDGALRPNPDTNDLNAALFDVRLDSKRYVNWPSVYFVCGNNITKDPDSTTESVDASANATEALNALIAEYNCLEEEKKETPAYASNNVCLPNYDDASYKEIRKNVWLKCGCESFPFPNDPDEPYCPDFGLKTVNNDLNIITDVVCDIPTTAEVAPIQNLQFVVPARSAPHRFYDTGGINYDELDKITINPAPTQEGEEFSYLDPTGKTTPLKTTFSMNAILGQMTLDLTGALPAKMLPVEFDQTYIITTLSGFYTPCSSCEVDSWYTAFSPHPTSQNGLGLRAVGYSTNRQNYQDNITNGNYEDTIFGRACWLPPTMLPFSHQKNANLITQRSNRLATQSALYINGYQRDWFGFNKGAIIGSFDGVRWFAIGKGRRITATSKKLFLAINAPFADLADNTSMTVSIVTDLGVSVASNVDYEPGLSPDDPLQNEGASCQMYHQCDVDADCISNLGWEYTCAEVNQFKTHIPKFDEDANEIVNEQISKASFDQLLHGTNIISGQKRCVYRGAGSICKVKYNQNGLTNAQKELFQCAPNFYCEPLNGNKFNEELVRTPSAFNNILFGQESDILGRPLNYNNGSGGGSLTQAIKDNIIFNSSIYFNDNITDIGARDFGVCRPGKNISINEWASQHESRDTLGRTDYISQISSCDSSVAGDNRYSSCPALDNNGNYIFDLTVSGIPDYNQNRLQNMCGKASLTSTNESTFKNIESGILGTFSSLVSKKVPADACLRRAGAICHTDLDCSPGPLHGEESQFFDRASFGNTQAELNFWQESLICSQATARPLLQSDEYFDYDMTQNRCCRETGKDLTMFTIGNSDVIPGNIDSTALNINEIIFPTPNATGRYSRYASIENLQSKLTTNSSTAPYPQIPVVTKNETPQVFQWKTINDTGKKTCCGGGWIRKFADGTNDWTNKNRLSIAPENFKCLNYQSDLPFGNNRGTDEDNYLNEYSRFCYSPGSNGCLQVPIAPSSSFSIIPPSNYIPGDGAGLAYLNTTPDEDPGSGSGYSQFGRLSREVPYMPIVFINTPVINTLVDEPLNFFLDNIEDKHWAVSFYLPAYIDQNAISAVTFVYKYADGPDKRIAGTQNCPGGFQNPLSLNFNEYCIAANVYADPISNPGRMAVFHARGQGDTDGDFDLTNEWKYGGIEIAFYPQNSLLHPGIKPASNPLTPGNDMYYLTKLGKLELLGIPQITYEPIYCSTERDKLVDGLFNLTNSGTTRNDFQTSGGFIHNTTTTGKNLVDIYEEDGVGIADDSNTGQYIVHADKLNFTPIFSDHEFKCCQQLGTTTTSDSLCCSNFTIEDPDNKDGRICALPSGTNLNVYFNRFVSSEGQTGDGAFVDTDFIPETGELKLNTNVYQKLINFGVQFCENQTVRGGAAFGNFNPSPHGTEYVDATNVSAEEQLYYSIVDEVGDYDSNDDSGYALFRDGYRWNHHQYCE